jgi:trafficking protein particle complex subunit 10
MGEEEDAPPPPPPAEEDEDVKDPEKKFDASSIQYRTIRDGFEALRNSMDGNAEENGRSEHTACQDDEKPDLKILNSSVTVNFIDPTTPPESKGKPPPVKPLMLYDKLTGLFEEEFRSKLRQVPYKHIRSGRNEVIDELNVRPVLTRSKGGTGANGEALTAWGGIAGAAATPVSDPAEWHNGPFCHVYIAACANMHDYRNKVRPSVQAFVSQIESAANSYNSSASGDGSTAPSGGNYSSQYIIVFVPVGPKTKSDSGDQTQGGRMGAALSRLATARQRMATGRDGDGSIHSGVTSMTEGSDLEGNDPMDVSMNSSTSASTSGMLFSKQDKELFRKFNSDFPNGTTCILSTLVESAYPDDPRILTLKQQEWTSFMRALGSCIVDGFKDRCRRYDEELRRLQMLPGTAGGSRSPIARGRKGQEDKKADKDGGMDLSHFFLVKESLAFTYEQMHLPAEALLQYSELRAFLPDIGGATIEDRKKSRKRRSSLEGNSALEIAIAGDILNFRKRMRKVTSDLKQIAHVVEQYIFSREVCLLFQMKQPVELIKRCHTFAETMYNFQTKGAERIEDEAEKQQQLDHAEEWALSFCWDIKCACEGYFTLMNPSSKGALYGEYPPIRDPDVQTILTERSLAREVSSLLEFGRLRLLALGDSKIDGTNPIRHYLKGVPEDMKKPWEPWNPESHKSNAGSSPEDDGNFYSSRDDFLTGAFTDSTSFVSKYVEVASAIATFGLFAGRQRIAATTTTPSIHLGQQ